MDPPSPDRKVKITYTTAAKRKRSSVSFSESARATPDADGSDDDAPPAASKAPDSRAPRKIEVYLPGPSPKRTRPADDAGAPAPAHRRSASISSARSLKPPGSPSSIRSAKPASRAAPAAPRASTPAPDASAPAPAPSPPRVRRSEAARIAYFDDAPDCGKAEPHRALCARCLVWVGLGSGQTYRVRPWERHRARCAGVPAAGAAADGAAEEDGEEEGAGSEDDDAASTVAPSVAASARSEASVRRTEAERRAILEADAAAAEVTAQEVRCRKCQKRIRLSKTTPYALGNWNSHQRRCADALPSSRVATAERKLRVVNDGQARAFTARSVDCAACGVTVALEGDGDYNLASWEAHKQRCHMPPAHTPSSARLAPSSSTSRLPLPPPAPAPAPAPTARPPPSTASTEGTLIASDGSPARRVLKRAREPDAEADAADAARGAEARPANRPRTEGYVPPEKAAPGPFGWFLLPFKAFVQGFRESLRADGHA